MCQGYNKIEQVKQDCGEERVTHDINNDFQMKTNPPTEHEQIMNEVIKKVDNFFLELEWHFAFSFQDVELEVHEKELKFETNEDRINYIKEEKLFNNYFDWIYRRIDNHLLYQLQEQDFAKALFFLERQIKFKESHYPDNRKINLRLATNSENGLNRDLNKNNKSGFIGVYKPIKDKRWNACIKINYKKMA
jgi:hypothetical protein